MLFLVPFKFLYTYYTTNKYFDALDKKVPYTEGLEQLEALFDQRNNCIIYCALVLTFILSTVLSIYKLLIVSKLTLIVFLSIVFNIYGCVLATSIITGVMLVGVDFIRLCIKAYKPFNSLKMWLHSLKKF